MANAAVFRKTVEGQAELARRVHPLAPPARRLLILVNGRRDATALRELLGPRVDLESELVQLRDAGLIETAAPEVIPEPAPAATAPRKGLFGKLLGLAAGAPVDPVLHERIREAGHLLHEALGPDADELAARIEDCRDPAALEAMLQRAADVVARARGDKEAETFRRALALATP
jgi:hypothetical protein